MRHPVTTVHIPSQACNGLIKNALFTNKYIIFQQDRDQNVSCIAKKDILASPDFEWSRNICTA